MLTPHEIESGLNTSASAVVQDEKTSGITIFPSHNEWSYRVALFDETRAQEYVNEHVSANAVYIELALVPEPENDYDTGAIAVVLPSVLGGSPGERRIGYLFRHDRGNLLAGLLNETQLYTLHEVRCFGLLDRNEESGNLLEVFLPPRDRLQEDLRAYVRQRRTLGKKAVLSPNTQTREGELRSFVRHYLAYFEKPVSRDAVSFRTGSRGRDEIRSISISTVKGNKFVGLISHGMLVVDDERRRHEIAKLASEAGISFAPSLEQFSLRLPEEDRLEKGAVPNIRLRVYEGYIVFELWYRENYGAFLSLAEYNRSTETLWIEDKSIADGVLKYAARIGLAVRDVGFPETPWWLDEQVHFSLRREYSLVQNSRQRNGGELLRGERPDEFYVRERHVSERANLFPIHSLSSEAAPCRLCKQESAIFTVPFCESRLSYCSDCLSESASGSRYRESDAKEIVRELTSLEFVGIPPLPSQLARVNSLGIDDLQAQDIDRMITLRAYIKPKSSSWMKLLAEAGLINDGIRLARGVVVPAQDGHLCRSLHEKAVDDFLHHHEIVHELEPHYPHDPVLNPNTRKRADWLLEDGTYVEMWGLEGDAAYDDRTEEKLAISQQHEISLVGIRPNDMHRLPEIFRNWL